MGVAVSVRPRARECRVSENKRILWLIVVMMAAVTISTAVAIGVLYWTAFDQERSHLVQTAEDQAHLMDAVARFDQLHGDGESGSPEAATLSQITTAFEHYPSNGQIAEITVAQRRGTRSSTWSPMADPEPRGSRRSRSIPASPRPCGGRSRATRARSSGRTTAG